MSQCSLRLLQVFYPCFRTHPHLENTPWFKSLLECLQALQQEAAQEAEEEQVMDEETQKIVDQIHQKVKKTSIYEFLDWIYKEHPPKGGQKMVLNNLRCQTNGLKDIKPTADNILKVVQRAISHYHPDKQTTHPKQWQIICNEITKMLNIKYSNVKGF